MSKENWFKLWGAGLVVLLACLGYSMLGDSDGQKEGQHPIDQDKVSAPKNVRSEKPQSGNRGKIVATQPNGEPLFESSYKVYIDERSGIAVEYDQTMNNQGLVDLFSKIDPVKAKRFQYNDIKVYLKDGAIVMIQRNPGIYESMSRAGEAWDSIEENGGVSLVKATSDYLDTNDDEKMKYLVSHLKSNGWGGHKGRSPDNRERTLVAVETTLEDSMVDKFSNQLDFLEKGKIYPAIFTVASSGQVPINQPHVYPAEVTIMRLFNIMVMNPEKTPGMFQATYENGPYIEEPTPEGIEKYGIIHPR